MYVPENLHHRRYAEWNYLIRGMVEVWELFRMLGIEHDLEKLLEADEDGTLFELLGRIGTDFSSLAGVLNARIRLLGAVPGGTPSGERYPILGTILDAGPQERLTPVDERLPEALRELLRSRASRLADLNYAEAERSRMSAAR